MKWLFLCALMAGAVYGIGKYISKTAFDAQSFVETPERRAELHKKYENVVNSPRATPRVKLEEPVSIIRWPTFQSSTVIAPPIEMRIPSERWAKESPVADVFPIGPASVRLRLDWPEGEEARAEARAREREMAVTYFRSPDPEIADPIHDARVRKREGVLHVTPEGTPREQAVLVYCPSYKSMDCDLHFEHLGRMAHVNFPQRRAEDWEGGLKAARALLGSIATPLERK